MKKHQFVKVKCDCAHRETNFICKYCGAMEHCSADEIRELDAYRSLCTGTNAPEAPLAESLKAKKGNGFDCLAQDYETWDDNRSRPGQYADPA